MVPTRLQQGDRTPLQHTAAASGGQRLEAQTCVSSGVRKPASLTRPLSAAASAHKFISLAQYREGFADRRLWPVLWPHLHKRAAVSTSRPLRRAPASSRRRDAAVLSPAVISRPIQPSQGATPRPPVWPPQKLESWRSPSSSRAQAGQGSSVALPESVSVPVRSPDSAFLHDAQSSADPLAVVFHPAPLPSVAAGLSSEAGTVCAPLQSPSPSPATAWQRLCANKGVQRALAIGRLAADCLDLIGSLPFAVILRNRGIVRAVVKNFRSDWQLLVHGAPVPSGPIQPGSRVADAAECRLAVALSDARAALSGTGEVKAIKERKLRAAVWGRGLVFAASLVGLGLGGLTAVAAPVLGGVMLGLSVFAARQAYANWRLARENLRAFREGGAPSPMGSNALGHVLREQYLKDPTLTPSKAQNQAVMHSLVVSGVSLAASVGTGAAAFVSLPAFSQGPATVKALSGVRTAVRMGGQGITPVAEMAAVHHADKAETDLAAQAVFDVECRERWQAFFADHPEHATAYRAALQAFHSKSSGVTGASTGSVHDERSEGGVPDLGPLVRWSRQTRHLGKLPDWIAATKVDGKGSHWAEQVLSDLNTIDQTRDLSRGMAGMTIVTHLGMSILPVSR